MPTWLTVTVLVLCAIVGIPCAYLSWRLNQATRDRDAAAGISPAQRRALDRQRAADEKEAAQARIVCQFCHVAGHVRVTHVQRKQGVSGGKATAGLLTGGVSLVLVGLSKQGWVNHLTCGNCKMEWDVA